MGFYSRVIFPRICNFILDQPHVVEHRRNLLRDARGDILEIGFGSGLNLPCYPPGVRQITAVDPNIGMNRLAQRRIEQTGIVVEQRTASGERLPLADGTFDCVVSTFTLCSVNQVSQVLAEVHRVLKPGGRFLFLEHGLSDEPAVRAWQRRLNWLQMRLGDGCRLDRNIQSLVAAQPFSSMTCDRLYLQHTPKTHGYLYRGAATKALSCSNELEASQR